MIINICTQLSVLREAALAREMHAAGLPNLKWVYLGTLFILKCPEYAD
jgi:hypothetical protein